MAEDTSILQEVDDALRADQLEQLWARYSGAIITFCVLAVLASAASVLWKNHLHELHERQTGLLIKASTLEAKGQYGEAISVYEKAKDDGGALGTLAALRRAQALMSMQQNDKALAAYQELVADKGGDVEAPLHDYAALQVDILLHNNAKPAAKTAENNSFHYTLSELSALRALQTGDAKTASSTLNHIENDDAAPFSQRERVGTILGSLKDEKK